MIHVCYGLNDKTGRYSKFVGTSILSMFENHSVPSSITVHIMHDNTLTQDSRDKFIYLAGRYGQQIKFYNAEKICAETVSDFREMIPEGMSLGSTFRLLVPQIISPQIEKMIYLDADTIVNLDISELWQIELDDKPMGAVSEQENGVNTSYLFAMCRDKVIKDEDYFNAGVLLMNLKQLRKNWAFIEEGLKFVVSNERYSYFDQDIFNYCFSTNYLRLPTKYNCFTNRIKDRSENAVQHNLYHYAGHPLKLDMRDAFNRLYFEYFTKTAWFNVDMLGNLSDAVRKIYLERQNLLAIVSAVVAGKQRVFVVEPQNVNILKNVFYVRDDEEIFNITSPNWLDELIPAIKNSRGQKVFFIVAGGIYTQVKNILLKEGFDEWHDFMNGELFLSEQQGVPFDSFRLIYLM